MQPRLKYLDEQISGFIKIYKPNKKNSEKAENKFDGFAAKITSFIRIRRHQ